MFSLAQNNCLQSRRRPHILVPLLNQTMKSLIYSITCLLVAGLLGACNTNKTETATTTAPEKAPAKTSTTTKKSTTKKSMDTTKKEKSSTDTTKKETTKKETTKKEKASPSPSPSATP